MEQTLNRPVLALVTSNDTCQLLFFTAFVPNKITVLLPFMPLCKWIRFVGGFLSLHVLQVLHASSVIHTNLCVTVIYIFLHGVRLYLFFFLDLYD